jgi:hypothetical protein
MGQTIRWLWELDAEDLTCSLLSLIAPLTLGVHPSAGQSPNDTEAITAIVIESTPLKKSTPGACDTSLRCPWRTLWLRLDATC